MNESAPDWHANVDGTCNYCVEYSALLAKAAQPSTINGKTGLDDLVSQIRKEGEGKRYDCIVGLSGGLDSAWTLYQAIKQGLRPLAVHMDNGWNSELAQSNIENLVRSLGVDLYTHVIDWPEYRSLMQAFFDADVIDVELLYDNAMLAVNYQQAVKFGVRSILAGTNVATEGMRMPPGWNWYKFDARNIRSIASRVKIRTFPIISTFDRIYYTFIRRIRWISFLDAINYKKAEALEVLTRDFRYKPYPYKHYESIFTRFYQGYILPRKFGVDKRRLHLSTLIVSGQMSREVALQQLAELPYPSENELLQDRKYFIKKMGWSESQLEEYLARPPRPHEHFASEKEFKDRCVSLYRKWVPGL